MMLIPAENKDLSLTLEVPAQTLVVKADWDRLTQVLTNLVANAIAYTEMGGVTVSLKELPDAVEVSVQDTGIGITPDDLQHIFERFYRADHDVVQANRGTGLGLAIVKSYIEMHGGRIWVSSKYGEGSTFTFILPRGQGI
jgi:signal transduction histidine kinase